MRTFICFAAALVITVAQSACSTEITLTDKRRVGIVDVRPVAAAGECVFGLKTEFQLPDGSVQRGTNAHSCYFATSGPPGVWTLMFTVPEGYSLAPGQENPVELEVVNEATSRIDVELVGE